MQLICEGLDLSEAVLKVSKALATKTTNPILEGIKLVAENDVLTLSATDMELSIEKKIRADIKVEGETVVPGRFFSEFIKKLTNDKIELTLNDKNQLKIEYSDSESFIQCFEPDEYPSFKKVESGDFFAISKINLKNIINRTIFAVAVDESRPILKGVLLENEDKKLSVVALDGYRLAMAECELADASTNNKIIIPSKSLAEISKIIEDSDDVINVYIQKNIAMFDLNDTKVTTRLIEGEFINYKQIISNTFSSTVKINRNQLLDALERASLLSKIGQNNLVKFEVKDQNMVVSSNSELGNVKEAVSINLTGEDLVIAFNARYFTESLRTLSDEFVNISFNMPNDPCIIKAIDNSNGYLYLILPVRII